MVTFVKLINLYNSKGIRILTYIEKYIMNIQAEYPKKLQATYWDSVNINYPIRKWPTTGISSETIGRDWQNPPDILPALNVPIYEEREYIRDYNVNNDLLKSQSSLDFGFKIPEASRFNKHTSCIENQYIYPPSKKLIDRTPKLSVHGTTEMRSSFTVPTIASRLVTNKDQFKHPLSLPLEPTEIEPYYKELDPLDTTHDGFEKYLDPYLTTSRFHHRPFTVEQIHKQSNSKDVLTYYTFSDIPWVRSPKPNIDNWRLSVGKTNTMYDREKFKDEFREIRTHRTPKWIPRAFRTENIDNYVTFNHSKSKIHNDEEIVSSLYKRATANLQTNTQESIIYTTENSQIGSRKPICTTLDQYVEKNKRIKN